jgi:hypothetical protein
MSPNATCARPCAPARRGHQLAHAKGLGQIIVGAGVERADLLGLVGAGRQHQHRHLGPRAQVAEHAHAVAVGQAQVQDYQVRLARAGLDQSALQRIGLVHGAALVLQRRAHEAADMRLVFHQQHRGRKLEWHDASVR